MADTLFSAGESDTSLFRTDGPYSLGMEFWVTSAASVTAIRFYRNNVAIGTGQVGAIYDSVAGTQVAGTQVNFAATSTIDWQVATLPSPVALTVNQRYRVVVYYPGSFAATPQYFTTGPAASGITSGVLTAPNRTNATSTAQCSYTTGASIAFPGLDEGSGSNWWMDVVVEPASLSVTTAALYPTTVASTAGTTWANTGNATGSTASTVATFTNTTSGGSGTIQLSGYGALAAVGGRPAKSVEAINVTVANFVGNTSRTASITVQLYAGTTPIGSTTALTPSTTSSNAQTVTLTGAQLPTGAQLTDLRAQVVFTRTAVTTANVFSLDYVGMTITYTPGPIGQQVSVGPQAVKRAATY